MNPADDDAPAAVLQRACDDFGGTGRTGVDHHHQRLAVEFVTRGGLELAAAAFVATLHADDHAVIEEHVRHLHRGVEHAFVDLGRDGHLDYRLPGELTERVPVIGLAQLLERIRPGRDAASDPTRVELALGTISFGTAVLRQLGVQVRRLWSLETPRG